MLQVLASSNDANIVWSRMSSSAQNMIQHVCLINRNENIIHTTLLKS